MAKINWEKSDYASAEELAGKIDWEGGLVEFVCGYGTKGLPEPLKASAGKLMKAYDECEKLFEDHGALP